MAGGAPDPGFSMMRVMTFNIRFETDRDGDNSWRKRRDLVLEVILRYAPDVLGTQEGLWKQLLFLAENLPGYEMAAPRRVIDDTSQYPTLFIKKSDWDIVALDEFWLSTKPREHRSKDWDSAYPRMMSAARIKCLRTDLLVWTAVTHLDHMGDEARHRQAAMLADWIAEREGPAVVMGDFNDEPGSSAYRELVSRRTALRDTWLEGGFREDEAGYTLHGFEGVPKVARIDWILARPDLMVKNALVIHDHEKGRYPSDHFPYLADLEAREVLAGTRAERPRGLARTT